MEIAEKHGIQLKKETLKLNESGVDFQAVFATDKSGKDWILRFPRRADVFSRTAPEKQVLDLIREQVDFEIPQWEVYTEELIAYKSLIGMPVATADIELQAYVWEIDEKHLSTQFVESLARALVQLHQIPKDEVAEAGIERYSAANIRQQMKTRMEKIKDKYGVKENLWERWQNWLANDEMWPKQTGLIHGDLHPGHIMIDEEEHVIGLLDWTEAKVTDSSKDFLGYFISLGESELERLLVAYKEAGGYYWPKMKEHILELNTTVAIDLAEFAAISGMEEYEKMAKQALGVLDE